MNLKASETLIRTHTELGPVYTVEPGGREIPAEEVEVLITSRKLIPVDGDCLFPDTPAQVWRKPPRRRKP